MDPQPPSGLVLRTLRIEGRSATLEADLQLPANARGVVLFARGSGSGRFSPRNREVAQELNEARLATVLVDLLTPEEQKVDERTRELRFDIELLAARLVDATDWLRGQAVIDFNRRALTVLQSEKHLVLVPGATHLFEQPNALGTVSTLARDWFLQHLRRPG